MLGILPLVHDMYDLIDKAVETDKSLELPDFAGEREQFSGALFAKFFSLSHGRVDFRLG